MQHTEGTFIAADGLTIYHQAWLPDSDPKAVVLLFHGLGEHSGRYAHVGATLSDAGYAVHAVDHRGHGRSDGKRAYVKTYDEFQHDLAQFRALVEQQHPELPVVVLGHSMGGNLAVGHVLDHQPGVRALALSAPALKAGESLSPSKIKLVMLVGRITPGLRRRSAERRRDQPRPCRGRRLPKRPARVHRQDLGRSRSGADRRHAAPSRRATPSSGSRSSCSTAPPTSWPTSPARTSSRQVRSTHR